MNRKIVLMLIVTTPLLGSGGGGHGPDWLALAGHIVNFLIMAGIFVWLGKRPVKEMLKQRRKSLKLAIESAQREREKAARELAFYEQKLASIDEEIASIEAGYLTAGEQKAAQLKKRNQEAMDRLTEQGKLQQSHAVEKMKHELMLTLSGAVLGQVESGLKKRLENRKQEQAILEQFKIG